MIQEHSDHKNIIIAFLSILVIALAGILIYLEFIDKDNSKCKLQEHEVKPSIVPSMTPKIVSPSPSTDPVVTATPVETTIKDDSFVYSDRNYGLASYGVINIKGYAEVKNKVLDCGVMGTCTEKEAVSVNDIVYFHITENNSDDVKKALKEWYHDEKNIVLGCIKDGAISYTTAADEFGPEKYEGKEEDAHKYYTKTQLLDKDISKKITASNTKKIISLKITKLKLSHYVSMDNHCYSPLSNIEVVE